MRDREKAMKRDHLCHCSVTIASAKNRSYKVHVEEFAKPPKPGQSLHQFLDGLPRLLAAKDLNCIADRVAMAHWNQKEIIVAMGAHVIKVGLSPVLIALMQKRIITTIVMNGAGIIHDVEIALQGKTSEDVGPALDRGMFGMAEETALFINEAAKEAAHRGLGFGQAIGDRLLNLSPPHTAQSILCQAHLLGIPVTIHVALGTDTIHMHPSADGGAIGKASLADFQRLTAIVAKLSGGVYFNIGSAVILPEVFLKALNLARNLGHEVKDFTTVNMDMITHYRPTANVIERPVRLGGEGFHLIGHHELNIPLLAAAILERMDEKY
jgi:hypothetical protein